MYIDLVILIIVLLAVVIIFRRFSSFVYAMAIVDIFLRIMYFLRIKVPLKELGNIFPADIPDLLGKYASDLLLDILLWAYVFIYTCFLVYITNYFIHKKK